MPPEEVEALAADFQRESERLAELRLEGVYDRVRELAVVDDDVFQ